MQQLQHQEPEQTSNHGGLILHASDVKPVSLLFYVISCGFFWVSKLCLPRERNYKIVREHNQNLSHEN